MLRTMLCVIAVALLAPARSPAQTDWDATEKAIQEAVGKNDHATTIRLAAAALPLSNREKGERSAMSLFLTYHLGRSYARKGDFAEAKPHLRRVVEGEWQHTQTDWFKANGNLWWGFFARSDGDVAAAEKYLDAADQLAATSQTIRDAVWNDVRSQKAELYASQGKLDKAIAEYAEQSRAVRQAANNDPEKGLRVEGTIAGLELRAGKPAQAVRRVESVLAAYESEYGNDDNRVLNMRLSLARFLVYADDAKRATSLIDGVEKVLAAREVERKAGGNNPFRGPPPALGDVPVYIELARQYHFLARYRDTLRVSKLAHELTVRGGGTEKAVVERLWAVADAHLALDELTPAAELLAAALPVAERLFQATPAAHAELLCYTLTRYGKVNQLLGRYRAAEELLLRAVRTAEAHPGDRSRVLASCLNWLSTHLTAAGLTDRAEEVAERAQRLAPTPRAATDAAGRALELYQSALNKLDAGDAAAAARLFDESQALQHTVDRCVVHNRLRSFASALEQRGELDLAVRYGTQEVEYNLRTHGPNYWQTMDARLDLSVRLRKAGRYREARAEIEKATAFFETGDSFNLCKL